MLIITWVNTEILFLALAYKPPGRFPVLPALHSTFPWHYADTKQYSLFFIPWVAASSLAWHSNGHEFASQLLHQILRFVSHICTCNTWNSGYCPVYRVDGNCQSIGSTVSDAIVRSWLWWTATMNSSLGYFSSITASSW